MFDQKKVEATLVYDTKPEQFIKHLKYTEGEGHALMDLLPHPRRMEDYYKDFERGPEICEDDRKKDKYERYELVSGLNEFFSARDFGYLVEQQVSEAIRSGYKLSIRTKPGGISFYTKVHGDTVAFAILGPSGSGKTTTLMFSLERYPKVIIHTGKNYRMAQVVYIKVDCPPEGSVKSFYDSCINELEIATRHEITDRNKAKSIDAKRQLFIKHAQRWNLGLLVIDEIQNLISAKKNVDLINQFLTLSNELKVPIAYVGTDMAEDFFKNSEFFVERRTGVNIRTDMFSNDISFELFMKAMWKYQWMSEYVPLTDEMMQTFFKETAGIVDRMVKLFKRAQQEAILKDLDNKAGFTTQFVEAVSKKYFYISRDSLAKMADPEVSSLSIAEPDLKRAKVPGLSESAETKEMKEESQEHINATIVTTEKEELKEAKEKVLYNVIQHFKYRDEEYTQKEMESAVNEVFKYKRKVTESEEKMTKQTIKHLLNSKSNIDAIVECANSQKITEKELPRFGGVL